MYPQYPLPEEGFLSDFAESLVLRDPENDVSVSPAPEEDRAVTVDDISPALEREHDEDD